MDGYQDGFRSLLALPYQETHVCVCAQVVPSTRTVVWRHLLLGSSGHVGCGAHLH